MSILQTGQHFWQAARHQLSDWLDWVYPVHCAGCSAPLIGWRTPGLCPDCERKILWRDHDSAAGSNQTEVHSPHLKAVLSAVRYREPARALIHDFKYRANTRLASYLAGQISARLQTCWSEIRFDYLVPVPMHPIRLKKRGYNQAILLAQEISRNLRIPLCPEDALRRIRNTPAQALTAPEHREANIANAFQAIPSIFAGKLVLVVDDVVTTGATVKECGAVLSTSGAESIYGCSWAG